MTKICSKCKIEKSISEFHKGTGKCNRASYCKLCQAEYSKKYHKNNKELHKQQELNYRKKHYIKYLEYHKKYHCKNKTKRNKNRRQWDKDNRLKANKAKANWQKGHKELYAHYAMLRYTKKKKACPTWVNKEELKQVYQQRPQGYCIDHIVPLQGKNVSGLHVPWNLQYLTHSENSKKSNKFE